MGYTHNPLCHNGNFHADAAILAPDIFMLGLGGGRDQFTSVHHHGKVYSLLPVRTNLVMGVMLID